MALTLTITDAGRVALVNGEHSGTNAVQIASVGVSGAGVAPLPTSTTLPGEYKRIATISGAAVAADIIHLAVRDESADAYPLRSFALYLEDGTMFAIYGQADTIVEKSAASLLLLAIDIALVGVPADRITFGNANFLNPPATTATAGVIELATDAEAAAMTDAVRALTPKSMAVIMTAANIIARMLTVDGSGSGLDADMLDGRHASEFALLTGAAFAGALSSSTFAAATNITAGATVAANSVLIGGLPAWHPGNDGAGSGLDADLLRGQVPSSGEGANTVMTRDGNGDTSVRNLNLFAPVEAINVINVVVTAADGRTLKKVTADTFLKSLDLVTAGNGASFAKALSAPSLTIQTNITAGATVSANSFVVGGSPVWHPSNDGAGSGLDSDLLDGQQGAWYADIASRLGYTPARRGGDTFTGPFGRDAQFFLDLAGGNATLTMGDGASVVFDRANNAFRFNVGGAERLVLTPNGMYAITPIIKGNAGKFLHHADGAIVGDTITRSAGAPAGGSDGDLHIEASPGAGTMRLWHNYGGQWLHT